VRREAEEASVYVLIKLKHIIDVEVVGPKTKTNMFDAASEEMTIMSPTILIDVCIGF
jgi:hypothetical protein